MIDSSIKAQIKTSLFQSVYSAIQKIFEYVKDHKYLPFFYTEISNHFEYLSKAEYCHYKDELSQGIPALKYDIPFFYTMSGGYGKSTNYGDILETSEKEYKINCHDIKEFDELIALLKTSKDIYDPLCSEEQHIETSVLSLVRNIVNRYIYITKQVLDPALDTELLNELVAERINRLYEEILNVNIGVPICFINFEKDHIQLTDTMSIDKIPYEKQLSRYNAVHFESTQESSITQCATHMLKLGNYSFENTNRDSFHNATANYWAYPLQVIDDFFASIRISMGCKTGYGQVLIEPIGWSDNWTKDLPPIYGANIRAFNPNETTVKFYGYHIYDANQEDIDTAINLFNIILSKRTEFSEQKKAKKSNFPFYKIFIAIDRLNRCMLRESDDDTALDAIIGIETLLSGDTHGEITYTISNRISVVASKLNNCPYSPQDMRRAMKSIYAFRSDIVHGRDLEKNSSIKIGGNNVLTKDLAVEFLRYSLLFIIQNQDFLNPNSFEEALDNSLSSNIT